MQAPYPSYDLKGNLPALAAAVFFLLLPAWYNSYPLITPDSGAYVQNAFLLYMPLDRPIGYSVLIRAASAGLSLWGVVIVQAALMAFFMQVVTRHLLGTWYRPGYFIAISLLVGAATSGGWFCGQLMPDIFTSILLLALFVLFCVPVRPTWHRLLLYLFIWICIILHNSNLMISLVFSLVVLFYSWRAGRKDWLGPARWLLGIAIAGWITLSSLNAIAGRGFRPSAATHVFLMCRMVENGIMDKFLADNCGNESYKLCAYKDSLPARQWDFMWNEHSPLYLTGGWEANEKEYSRIILKTLVTPKYLGLHLFKNTQATARQLPLIYIGDGLIPQGYGSGLFWTMQDHFRHELKEYLSCQQQTGNLKFDFFNALIILFALCTGVCAMLVHRPGAAARKGTYRQPFSDVFRLLLIFIIINAAVTATFSTVVGRFGSRVFWVLPFICTVYLIRVWLEERHAHVNKAPVS